MDGSARKGVEMPPIGVKRRVALAMGAAATITVVCATTTVAAVRPPVIGGAEPPTSRTEALVFQAFFADGKPAVRIRRTVNGSCFTGSLAINRRDAWRCMNGNLIYDPCFSSAKASGIVVCPTIPAQNTGVEVKLTKSLPRGNTAAPSTRGTPWAVQTTTGLNCLIDTGTGNVVQGMRSNYACEKSKEWLWGSPARKSKLWTIYEAPISTRKLTHRVKLVVAWF